MKAREWAGRGWGGVRGGGVGRARDGKKETPSRFLYDANADELRHVLPRV